MTADGYFRTGDIGYLDADGYLFIVDRKKDIIIRGGENISCLEVEAALYEHPQVAEAAVFGLPDEKWGERVVAMIMPSDGHKPTQDEIIAHCRQHIAGYKVPKTVDVVTELPRNPTGKILKRELRKPYWEGRDRQVV